MQVCRAALPHVGYLRSPPRHLGSRSGSITFELLGANPADFNADGVVDSGDLATMLASWGGPGADLTGDSVTDASDLAVLLASWG